MAEPPLTGGFDLPFAEQADVFRKKLNLPTERWDDIWQSAHDRSFVVAGAMKADLLDELRQAVDKAITKGSTLETFRKEFRDITDRLGWPGKAGQGTLAGFNWRTKVIYETNLRASYAAGRWAQLNDPGLQKLMPYWRYVHNESVLHPRPLHAKWGAMRLTLRHDHPFWQTHFPPNGWGCRCRVVAVTGPKKGDATAPPEGWDDIDEKTGAPVGIDKGWGYAPGANAQTPLKDIIDQKLINLDAPIGAAMWEALRPALAKETAASFGAWVDAVITAGRSRGQHAIAGAMTRAEIDYYARAIGSMPVSAEIAVEDRLLVGKKAARHAAEGNALTPEEWKSLPDAMENDRAAYFDKVDKKMIYLLPSLDGDRSIKLAVQVDFMIGHPKKAINAARAGFKVDVNAFQDKKRYERVE